jgi:hypothetical protein
VLLHPQEIRKLHPESVLAFGVAFFFIFFVVIMSTFVPVLKEVRILVQKDPVVELIVLLFNPDLRNPLDNLSDLRFPEYPRFPGISPPDGAGCRSYHQLKELCGASI